MRNIWIILAVALVATGTPAQSEEAPETQALACELHVWGAVKTFPENSRFAGVFARKGTFHADRREPLANINVLDPVIRMRGVPDTTFAGLFPEGTSLSVVRHENALDLAKAKKARQPLSRQTAACHADLILSELADVEFTNGQPQNGVLTGLLMARGGMHMKIAFTRYDGDGRLVARKRDGSRGDLAIGRSAWSQDQPAALQSIDASIIQGIERFVAEHGERPAAR